ncbi:MAG TPA: mechanosensitive ion channel family protein [Caulobacter sp.]|nr:mechanosensitive ion channel family protein [Caulobacter sp.]
MAASPNSLDPSALAKALPSMNAQDAAAASFLDRAAQFGTSLIVAVVILTITFWLSKWLSKLACDALEKLQKRKGGDPALRAFVHSAVRYLIIIIGLVAVLQQLGVKTTSILAVLGAASLAIGLAMQGALSNVAAGVMLLILRPYHAGDLVVVNGQKGRVRDLDLFTTELETLDGLKVIVPNGKIFGELIINQTVLPRRRFEIVVGIDYEDDIDEALRIMLETCAADERVLKDPEPWARCTGLGDSAVNLTLRAWALQKDFWDAHYAVLKAVKEAFDREGIRIPYPHQVQVDREPRQVLVTGEIASPKDGAPEPPKAPSRPVPPPAPATAHDQGEGA